ncbi:MAG: PQQ-binding-like beta-propeller repeat protein [Bacteroidales bacterium]|jgi:outer membrane protein assembly factor BamB|nr:PQQ-binding-like beta-propeller repeat protein [Bacteroidales bacterium]
MKKTLTIAALFITILTYAADPGTLKWTYDTNDDLRGCPAIADDGTIYVGSKNSKLSAINPDGTLKWEFETLGITWASPAIGADGTIYIGSGISSSNYSAGNKENFFAINPDGTLKWSAESGLVVDNSPAIGPDGTIYHPSSTGLAAYDPDGTLKWDYSDVGNSYASPAISSDGTIFIAGASTLYALNANGTLKWSVEMEYDVRSSPAIGADGTVYIGAKDNYLYALHPSNGTEKWKFDAGSFVLSAPIVDSDGVIYFGSYKGKFYALNPDGTEKWFYQFSEELGFLENNGAVIGDNNVIYVGASDPVEWYVKKVYALNLDGTIKWEYISSLVVDTPPTLASDGTVYIGTAEGELLAIEGESTGVADSPWPKYKGNTKNTCLGIDTPENNATGLSLNKQSFEVNCYPNPFVTSTTIDFFLNKPETVIVKIYSVLGAEIETLYNGVKQAGNHSVIFDATRIAGQNTSQIYLCKIQTGSKITTNILFQEN